MFQNEILVEILLVHFVHFGRVHKVNYLTDTVDRLTVVDSDAVPHPSPCSRWHLSVGSGRWSMIIRAFAKIGKPRCSIVLD